MSKPKPEPVDPAKVVDLALAVIKADAFPVLASIDGDQPCVRPVSPVRTDHFTVYVNVDGDSIQDIGFQGSGCAISKASTSMMTQVVKGKSKAEAEKLFETFHKLVTEGDANGNSGDLGKLAVFSVVSEFPVRVKCATLAWHTLKAALEGKQGSVSTE